MAVACEGQLLLLVQPSDGPVPEPVVLGAIPPLDTLVDSSNQACVDPFLMLEVPCQYTDLGCIAAERAIGAQGAGRRAHVHQSYQGLHERPQKCFSYLFLKSFCVPLWPESLWGHTQRAS